MGKLWQKDYQTDKLLESFTVGEDYLLDKNLVAADCAASTAHAVMLKEIGLLSASELEALQKGLQEVINLQKKGEFSISIADEDCHTAIENFLVGRLGEAGKKIHTGRSRNDQIIAALRLYAREFVLEFKILCCELIETLFEFAEKNKNIPMPGRTHMQIAMPSSVGLWAASFAEILLDDLKLLKAAYDVNNSCPLGSAASYGVPLPLNRELVARLLGFARVQNNVLAVNNSRGKTEAIILDAVEQVVLTLSKLAQDLILFTMPEFKYFSLPDELCTGSSIMPQKKNPDGLELLRAKSATISSYAQQIKNTVRSLPSGYNRDFQETKSPFMRGINLALGCVRIAVQSIKNLTVHTENLVKGFIPEIYATDYAIELVTEQAKPFRDAYKEVAANIAQLASRDPVAAITAKNYPGAPGNLNLAPGMAENKEILRQDTAELERIHNVIKDLTGTAINLFGE